MCHVPGRARDGSPHQTLTPNNLKGDIIASILQMRKPMLSQVKELNQKKAARYQNEEQGKRRPLQVRAQGGSRTKNSLA
jgi:hypothetical protein